MIARLAMPGDKDAVLSLAELQVLETLPHLDFRRDIAEATFDQSIETADPTIFVVEDRREVIGFLMGLLEGYAFTSGVFCVQEVIYVRPDKRGTRAAALLLREFKDWSRTVGAREAIYGISNMRKPAKFVRFVQRHTGAELVGVWMKAVA